MSGMAAGELLTLVDDTIDGNTSAINGGGVYQDTITVSAKDTIVAHDTAGSAGPDYDYASGKVTDAGGNLLGSTAGDGGKFGAGTIVADPKLGPLADNGGADAGARADSQIIPTQALLPGSPAFGKGITTGTEPTDGRGFVRSPSPSIGAYEPQYASNATPNQVFVENLYEVLLDRVADPGSLANGVNYLNGGGAGVTLVQILQGSAEYRDIEATQVYLRYLDRAPVVGRAGQRGQLPRLGYARAARRIPTSPEQIEFYNDYGQNNDVFVEALYGDILDRTGRPPPNVTAGSSSSPTTGAGRASRRSSSACRPTSICWSRRTTPPTSAGCLHPRSRPTLAVMWPSASAASNIQALLLASGEAFAWRTWRPTQRGRVALRLGSQPQSSQLLPPGQWRHPDRPSPPRWTSAASAPSPWPVTRGGSRLGPPGRGGTAIARAAVPASVRGHRRWMNRASSSARLLTPKWR